MDLYKLTAHELHEKLVNKEVSSVELTNAVIARVDAVEDQVNAYVTLDKENALAQAAKVDAKIAAGLGLAVGLDFANSIISGGPTNTELILTTTVTRDGQYVARKTDVYYLENVDTPLFMRPSITVPST